MLLHGLVVGGGFGLGLAMILRGLYPPLPPLADVLASASAPRWRAAQPSQRDRSLLARVAGRLTAPPSGRGSIEADLTVMDESIERLAVDRLVLATVFPAIVVVFGVAVSAAGSGPPVLVVAMVAVASVAVGLAVPGLALGRQAAARRDAFREVLASYLDLVTIQLASGAGVEEALREAAAPGDGWAFAALRDSLVRAELAGVSPWSGLDEMGQRRRLPVLGELVSSVTLAGEEGARVRRSLTAKAVSLRASALAHAQAQAESRSEHMAAPVVLMLVGFTLLIGFPAVSNLLRL